MDEKLSTHCSLLIAHTPFLMPSNTTDIPYTLDTGEKLVNETFGPDNIHRRHIGAPATDAGRGRPRKVHRAHSDYGPRYAFRARPRQSIEARARALRKPGNARSRHGMNQKITPSAG